MLRPIAARKALNSATDSISKTIPKSESKVLNSSTYLAKKGEKSNDNSVSVDSNAHEIIIAEEKYIDNDDEVSFKSEKYEK